MFPFVCSSRLDLNSNNFQDTKNPGKIDSGQLLGAVATTCPRPETSFRGRLHSSATESTVFRLFQRKKKMASPPQGTGRFSPRSALPSPAPPRPALRLPCTLPVLPVPTMTPTVPNQACHGSCPWPLSRQSEPPAQARRQVSLLERQGRGASLSLRVLRVST